MLIMNADVFLEEALLDDILSYKISPVLFSDETRKEEADFKLINDYIREQDFFR